MRRKIVAGNWKMNLNREESLNLVNDIGVELKAINHNYNDVEVMVSPTSVNLVPVFDSGNKPQNIEVIAQNMHFADSGAYTGEISASMLQSVGVNTVILGHSERRAYFHEDNALLAKKVDAALVNNMQTIFCFGEELEDRNADNHFSVVESQLSKALFHLEENQWQQVILAYEPVWAIGTGETATPEQAQEMHAFIRQVIAKKYSQEIANSVSILYGGSVKPANAKDIFSKPDVDGGLIGGASLKAKDFVSIINSF